MRMVVESRIDTVVFDLGGVLIRIARSWKDAHLLAGFDDKHPGLVHQGLAKQSPRLAREHMSGTIDLTNWARAIKECSDNNYSVDDAIRIMDAWIIAEYPRIRSVIDTIHDAGIDTAVLSNTNARHWQLLGADDRSFNDYPNLAEIHQIHASHLLGHVKPDPEIYESFTKTANLGSARILFFDDTMLNIDAARHYGWAARHIDHTGDTAKQMLTALTHHRII